VAVVNSRFAGEFGAPAEVLGRRLTVGRTSSWKIVGVVKAMDYMAEDADDGNAYQVFIPADSPGGYFSTIVARVDGRAEDRVAIIRDTIRSVDPEVPVFGAKTMAQRLDDALARPRFYSTAVLLFAGFALLLAVIGIYGIVSYAVAQRIREMGVRLALGATPMRLRGVLLRQGLMTVAAGAIPGVALAMASGRVLEGLIDGAKFAGMAMPALSALFIAAIASASIWAATRRIARLDIVAILRTE
jgi:ABC-type antimicrobial peptide transport system permease subunit